MGVIDLSDKYPDRKDIVLILRVEQASWSPSEWLLLQDLKDRLVTVFGQDNADDAEDDEDVEDSLLDCRDTGR